MSIKGGDLIHVAGAVLFDRVQTGGPGQLNIPTEKIYELGDYQSVGTVLDIPDISYSLESFDASAELEATLCGTTFASDTAGTEYLMSACRPLDVAGQFKRGKLSASKYEAPFSVTAPYLVMESLSYRFGLRDNASQTVGFKGDSLFYAPGSAYIEETAGSNTASQEITLAHHAYPYNGDTAVGVRYVLSVSLKSGTRLRAGVDYTEAATGSGDARAVTVTIVDAVPTSDKIRITYTSDTVASYDQSVHAAASATRPAAIRGRDILLYINDVLWTGVQSANVDFRLTVEKDEEFGNQQVVGQDYDVPATTGAVTIKPRSTTELMAKIYEITGVDGPEAVGALQREELPVEIVLKSPEDGTTLKTLYVADAKFTLPGYSGRVQQKLSLDLNFESQSGELYVYKGDKP